jgi:RHS repeat-associated protein
MSPSVRTLLTHDGLGRPSGLKTITTINGVNEQFGTAVSCVYDPVGRQVTACAGHTVLLGLDGESIVRAGNWGIASGPGLDDPLVGIARGSGVLNRELYYITDGQGRHLAAGENDGSIAGDIVNGAAQYDGWQATGAASIASGYGAGRLTTGQTPGLAFYRNRIYDQATGRWTQEDPLGVAGGLNLYQFNGNDPVSYSDPFGLCPPQDDHPCSDKDEALQAPLIDPVAIVAGGIAGGLRALFGSIFRSAVTDATATVTVAAAEEASPNAIRFGQKAISSTFRNGKFAGKSVQSVAEGLENGVVSADELPVNVVIRGGVQYTMNNRSLMALRLAGKAPTVVRDVTGNAMFERQLTERLAEMGGNVAADFAPAIRP